MILYGDPVIYCVPQAALQTAIMWEGLTRHPPMATAEVVNRMLVVTVTRAVTYVGTIGDTVWTLSIAKVLAVL